MLGKDQNTRLGKLRGKVSKAMEIFVKTKNELTKVNEEIEKEMGASFEIIKSLEAQAEEQRSFRTECGKEIESNKNIIEKLDKFLS